MKARRMATFYAANGLLFAFICGIGVLGWFGDGPFAPLAVFGCACFCILLGAWAQEALDKD